MEYEKQVGNLVDKVSGTKNYYLVLAVSEDANDRSLFVNQAMKIYDELSKGQRQFLNGYLIGYSEGVEDYSIRDFVESRKDNLDINVKRKESYNPTEAKNYAHKYYKNYNLSEYPNLNGIGGDCTNFVSQCIYKGGKKMDDTWYIKKLNDDNPEPTSNDELNESWDLADPSPWISAKEFGNYWSDKALKTKTYKVSDYLNLSDKSISGYATGDVVQITKRAIINFYGYHTMLITKIDDDDFLYTAHYKDRKDANLTSALENYNKSKYKVKFYAMW